MHRNIIEDIHRARDNASHDDGCDDGNGPEDGHALGLPLTQSPFHSFWRLIGASRSRTPVSRATALLMAGATMTTDIWPIPVG